MHQLSQTSPLIQQATAFMNACGYQGYTLKLVENKAASKLGVFAYDVFAFDSRVRGARAKRLGSVLYPTLERQLEIILMNLRIDMAEMAQVKDDPRFSANYQQMKGAENAFLALSRVLQGDNYLMNLWLKN